MAWILRKPYCDGGGGVFYPTFLFFEFLKNGCNYQIQIWHACEFDKMPSYQRSNEDTIIKTKLQFDENSTKPNPHPF